MGSCYSVPFFLLESHKANKCSLCWEIVNNYKSYIKCSNCLIFLHENCLLNSGTIRSCPNCKLNNSLVKWKR